jgi:hypothetical protein
MPRPTPLSEVHANPYATALHARAPGRQPPPGCDSDFADGSDLIRPFGYTAGEVSIDTAAHRSASVTAPLSSSPLHRNAWEQRYTFF